MIRLTGSQNPLIKEVRALKSKNNRDEKGLYFIEGTRFIEEALKENIEIRYVVVSETFSSSGVSEMLLHKIDEAALSCYVVPDSLFVSISDTKSPQGVLAVLRLERLQLEDAALSGETMLILDTIKDPGNMGAMIRTADAAGCSAVIVPDGCVDVFNPKVLRSTMGSIFHVAVYHCRAIADAMTAAKKNGFMLFASHLEGSQNIYETNLTGQTALIVGSEAEGIGTEAVKNADVLIRIPMEGSAESLNASVAAGVILFEAMRQRRALP